MSVDAGAMCFASGARGHWRGATEMPLSTSICSVLFFVSFWVKKCGGGDVLFQIVKIGVGLSSILSSPRGAGFPIWVLKLSVVDWSDK